jgi:hypothetical protein
MPIKYREETTYVKVIMTLEENSLSFFCSNVSCANCGSSGRVTLNREIRRVRMAILSVSENLLRVK